MFGVVGLLFSATGLLIELQDALNIIWEVKPSPRTVGWRHALRGRIRSFAVLSLMNLLLLGLVLLNPAVALLQARLSVLAPLSALLLQSLCYLTLIPAFTLLFTATLLLLPDTALGWRDALRGGFCTALLFLVGRVLVGWYLGHESMHAQFGASGALAVLLLWIYYCAQLFFLGAELTRVCAGLEKDRGT